MPDIQDEVIKAIQDYGFSLPQEDQYTTARTVILAFAERMAPHIITKLGLQQEWAVGTLFNGKLDDIDDEDTDVQRVMDALERAEEFDRRWGITEGRLALTTRFFTEWAEEVDPEIDEHLVDLVANDEPVGCVSGRDPDEHDWHPSGLPNEYECKNCKVVTSA